MDFFFKGGTPSLEVLWLSHEPAAQALRLDTLLACFNLSSAREELQAVESPLRALCCLLVYLFVQVNAELTVQYVNIDSPLSLASPSWSAESVSMARPLSTEHNESFTVLMEMTSQDFSQQEISVSTSKCSTYLVTMLTFLSEYCGKPRRINYKISYFHVIELKLPFKKYFMLCI